MLLLVHVSHCSLSFCSITACFHVWPLLLNCPTHRPQNLFGAVLDHKLVAEKYIKASGINYTIVRPGEWRVPLMRTKP